MTMYKMKVKVLLLKNQYKINLTKQLIQKYVKMFLIILKIKYSKTMRIQRMQFHKKINLLPIVQWMKKHPGRV